MFNIERWIVGILCLPFVWIFGILFLSLYPVQKVMVITVLLAFYALHKLFSKR